MPPDPLAPVNEGRNEAQACLAAANCEALTPGGRKRGVPVPFGDGELAGPGPPATVVVDPMPTVPEFAPELPAPAPAPPPNPPAPPNPPNPLLPDPLLGTLGKVTPCWDRQVRYADAELDAAVVAFAVVVVDELATGVDPPQALKASAPQIKAIGAPTINLKIWLRARESS